MNNSQVLSIAEAQVVYNLGNSFASNIILNHNKYFPWFFSEYIQIYSANDNEFDYFTHGNIYEGNFRPVEVGKISSDIIGLANLDIIDIIISLINSGFYVLAFLNEKYILFRNTSHDFIHNIFIYGYNKNSQIFNMMGFKNGIYQSTIASFDEIKNAYTYRPDDVAYYAKYIYHIKPRTDLKCKLDICKVYNSLLEYLYPTSALNNLIFIPNTMRSNDWKWGVDCYGRICSFFSNAIKMNASCDIRMFHLLWEHKNIMLMRIDYLRKNGYISKDTDLYNAYKPIVNKTLTIRNKILKYNMTRIIHSPESVIKDIENAIYQEKIVLSQLLDEIRKNLHSEWALNSIMQYSSKNKAPLLECKKYITILRDYSSMSSDNIQNDLTDIPLNENFIVNRYAYESCLHLKETFSYGNGGSLLVESEYSDNVYTMPFKSECLKVYEAVNDKSNIIFISSENIERVTAELSNLSNSQNDVPYFIILLVNGNTIKPADIKQLINKFPEYSIENAYNFFSLYRDASGFDLNKNIYLDDSGFISSMSYSKQSGNCICGNSETGDYISLENNSWLCYNDIKCINNKHESIFFYIDKVVGTGELCVRLDSLEGDITAKCEIYGETPDFKIYKCRLNAVKKSVGCENYYNLYISASGDENFKLNLYGYKLYEPCHTNSLSIDLLNFVNAENIKEISSVSEQNYSIIFTDGSELSYANILLNKQLCEFECVIEDGHNGDIISLILNDESGGVSVKKSAVLVSDDKVQTVRLSFGCINGNYNMSLQYKSADEQSSIILHSVKCSIDIFEKVSAIEYSECQNITNEKLDEDNYGVGYIVGFIENNSYVCYHNVNFYKDIKTFNVMASSGETSSASIEVRIGSADGDLIGECIVSNTTNWGNFTHFMCTVDSPQGRNDLYLIFKGKDNTFLMNFTQFWFE